MTVVVVSAPNSYEKQVKYNVNQQLLAVTQGSVPGLQEEIKEYPKSIVGAIKKALQSDSGLAFLGLQTVTQNLTSLDMSKGYIVDSNMNIYFIEQLTLTPTSESFWGFYEIEISEEDSDELTLGFVNPSTSPKTFYTSNGYTKKKYKVSIYENYNTTAEFPTLTAGRTKWVEYKKDAAFGNIVSNTNYLKTKFVLNTDVQDSLTSTETEKPLSAYQGKLINDSFLIGEIKAWDKSLGSVTLPDNYLELNGQLVSDAASPFNNKRVRNLNGAALTDISIASVNNTTKEVTLTNPGEIFAYGVGDTLTFDVSVPNAVIKSVDYATGKFIVGDSTLWSSGSYGLTTGTLTGATLVSSVGLKRYLGGSSVSNGSDVNQNQGHWHDITRGDSTTYIDPATTSGAGANGTYQSGTKGSATFVANTIITDTVNGVPRIGSDVKPNTQEVVFVMRYKV